MSVSNTHPYLNKEQQKIRSLFDRIAVRYDMLNHLLSMNMDKGWRRRAIRALEPRVGGSYLDCCTGTGDLVFTLADTLDASSRSTGPDHAQSQLIGCDFSTEMIAMATQKRAARESAASSQSALPSFLAGDALRLPFPSQSFDGVTVGFGIRNVEDLPRALSELTRVLRPGGRLVLLEFTEVRNRVLRPFVNLYNARVVPFVGNLLSRSSDRAYSYLNESIGEWERGDGLATKMREAGLENVEWRALFPSNVALHVGVRDPEGASQVSTTVVRNEPTR